MPTYEYLCDNGHSFEEFQSIVADPIDVCPLCGARTQRLVSGGSGLIFKGSGFYITDYSRKSRGRDAMNSGESKPPKAETPPAASPPPSSPPNSGGKSKEN